MSNTSAIGEHPPQGTIASGIATPLTASLLTRLGSSLRNFLVAILEILRSAMIYGALLFAWTVNVWFFAVMVVLVIIPSHIWRFLFPPKVNHEDTVLKGAEKEKLEPDICAMDEISDLDLDLDMTDGGNDEKHLVGQATCNVSGNGLGKRSKDKNGKCDKCHGNGRTRRKIFATSYQTNKARAQEDGNGLKINAAEAPDMDLVDNIFDEAIMLASGNN